VDSTEGLESGDGLDTRLRQAAVEANDEGSFGHEIPRLVQNADLFNLAGAPQAR